MNHLEALALLESGAGLQGCEVRTFQDLGQTGGAIFSACGTYRYLLWRHWADPRWSCGPMLGWVMLNPSTADERELDPTLNRCAARTSRFGRRGEEAAGMVIANLFALRSTDPAALKKHAAPVGPENLAALEALAAVSSPVICGWGFHGSQGGQDRIVRQFLTDLAAHLLCYGTTKDGAPRHPLYLPYSAGLQPLEVS